MTHKIAFIGSGNMAEAIMSCLIKNKIYSKTDILACDVNRERISYIGLKLGVHTSLNNPREIYNSDMIVLSVKPQTLDEVMNNLGPSFNPNSTIISILAGTKRSTIESYFKNSESIPPIARVMPNMGAFVGESVSALSFNTQCSQEHKQSVLSIFSNIGYAFECEEALIDTVTAVSGSGPAYLFYYIEAMIEAAVKLGLSEEQAFECVTQTVKGSIDIVNLKKNTPQKLREKVTSKGGTTQKAIESLEQNHFKKLIEEALTKAKQRAEELSE